MCRRCPSCQSDSRPKRAYQHDALRLPAIDAVESARTSRPVEGSRSEVDAGRKLPRPELISESPLRSVVQGVPQVGQSPMSALNFARGEQRPELRIDDGSFQAVLE